MDGRSRGRGGRDAGGGSITLSRGERKRLLAAYRGGRGEGPQVRLRAHLLLLLSEGHTWATICAVLFCSAATVARWKGRFEAGGVDRVGAVLGETRGRRGTLLGWADLVVLWARNLEPRDFGYFRSRWSCAALALVLWSSNRVRASPETVRRMLHAQGMAWCRPRPVPGREDPRKAYKLRKVRELLRDLPADEAAVFQDEVDVNLNPDIGCMWAVKGQQAQVVTPGTNVKRYLAGSMSWRTGELIVTEGTRRNAELFVRHLHELRRRFARFKKGHVVCDNARFHTARGSKLVRQFLEQWGDKVVLHYLPAYSPNDNPVERVWWHLHEEVTRNHRCKDIHELVKLTLDWVEDRRRFKVQGRMYQRLKERLKGQAEAQAAAA